MVSTCVHTSWAPASVANLQFVQDIRRSDCIAQGSASPCARAAWGLWLRRGLWSRTSCPAGFQSFLSDQRTHCRWFCNRHGRRGLPVIHQLPVSTRRRRRLADAVSLHFRMVGFGVCSWAVSCGGGEEADTQSVVLVGDLPALHSKT